MRKYYLIRARLLGADGSEQKLIWKVKQAWFWESPVDIISEYMGDQAKNYPRLGFDLTEFREV